MGSELDSRVTYGTVDFTDPKSLEEYARQLVGMTFQEVLDLDIAPKGAKREYGSKSYKGGMGNLIEERFFGYRANSDDHADFPQAGVELKVSCYDVKKNGDLSAGERLVLTMIPFDKEVEEGFEHSHLWEKCGKILLIYYHRDRTKANYDQTISYVSLFTPSETDLKIIRDDYEKINSYIKAGRADELSEGLTTYLGACTKGANEASMWREQYYPALQPDGSLKRKMAKRRAFCFKRQYMDYVLHHHMMVTDKGVESIIKDPSVLGDLTFEDYIVEMVARFAGKTDRELCELLDLPYTGNKAQWTTIVFRMLGLFGDRAEEFQKANISIRTVRVEASGKIVQNLSLKPFRFKKLVEETWEDSPLHTHFEETKFFFIVFANVDGEWTLKGARFWNMPKSDIDGPLRDCWEETRRVLREGVKITKKTNASGKVTYSNNLPGVKDNPVAHVRPHAKKAAYLLEDGVEVGDINADADELPDGRWMTRQSFWLKSDYVYEIVRDL